MTDDAGAAGPPADAAPAPRGRVRRMLSGSAGGVLWMMLGSGVGQALTIAVLPILSRVYTEEDFGLLTQFVAISSITGTFVVFRLEAAVPLPKSERAAAAVAWLGIGLGLIGSVVIGALGPLIALPVGKLVGVPELGTVWWWLAAATFAVVLDKVLLTWMVREKRYKALASRNFLQGLGQAGFQVGFAYAPFKSVGLLVGWILGRVVALGGLFSRGGLLTQGVPHLRDLTGAARRYRRFPLVASWAALINVLGQQAPFLVLGFYYGKVEIGLIGMTTRVLAAPVTLVGQAVSRVFQGEGSEAIRLGTKQLKPIIRANVKALSAISLPVALLFVLVSPPLFAFALGAQWREAGVYAQILALGYAAQLIVSPISQTLLLLEKQGQQLAWDTLRLVATVGAPLLVAAAGGSATAAVFTLSAAFVVCYGALWWTCHVIAGRYDATVAASAREPGTDTPPAGSA